MNLTLGWIVATVSILAGYVGVALGAYNFEWDPEKAVNALKHLWQPFEYLIILGSAFGAMLASNKKRVLVKVWYAIKKAFKPNQVSKETNLQLLGLMFTLLNKIKTRGLLAIEEDVENPQASMVFKSYPMVLQDKRLLDFITDYLRMMLAGSINVIQLESLMEQEIELDYEDALIPAEAVHTVADGLPAFGIVAAIMGVVLAMQSINEPTVGEKIATALVGTFLGVLLSYAFVTPVAKVLDQNAEVEMTPMAAVKAILVAYLNGYTPSGAVEFGRKVFYADQRPSYDEVEQTLRGLLHARGS